MAYCNKCGAYIPDEYEVCLACGYDPKEAEKTQESAQTAQQTAPNNGTTYSFTNEELKKKLDEQRRKQQEQAKAWAEQEKQRRQTADNRQYTEKKAEKAPYDSTMGKTNWYAILSYISALFVLPFFLAKDDDYAMFHANQGLRLFIFAFAADLLRPIPIVGALANIARLYLAARGVYNAIKGKKEPLPYIGRIGMK